MSKLPYLNLGCGSRFHVDWTNMDMVSASKDVIQYNILKKLPFENNTFDAVYHSHVLEHIPIDKTEGFIRECHRILKPDGIIRIAVPDLESIIRNYLKLLEGNLNNPTPESIANYDWIMLELYDQTTRNYKGGEMKRYLEQPALINEGFILSRIGAEGQNIINNRNKGFEHKWKKFKALSFNNKVNILFNLLLSKLLLGKTKRVFETGSFRLQGEIHQWMYDRFSLGRLLMKNGFRDIKVKSAFESEIPNWNNFELDGKDSIVFKPDSLFMEARK